MRGKHVCVNTIFNNSRIKGEGLASKICSMTVVVDLSFVVAPIMFVFLSWFCDVCHFKSCIHLDACLTLIPFLYYVLFLICLSSGFMFQQLKNLGRNI